MNDPIAYTYEADTHCVGCAIARFGQEPGHQWVSEDARDSEGNPVGVIAPWDEWCDTQSAGHQALVCGTCLGVITEHEHVSEFVFDPSVLLAWDERDGMSADA